MREQLPIMQNENFAHHNRGPFAGIETRGRLIGSQCERPVQECLEVENRGKSAGFVVTCASHSTRVKLGLREKNKNSARKIIAISATLSESSTWWHSVFTRQVFAARVFVLRLKG
jgi:hypothetical protein